MVAFGIRIEVKPSSICQFIQFDCFFWWNQRHTNKILHSFRILSHHLWCVHFSPHTRTMLPSLFQLTFRSSNVSCIQFLVAERTKSLEIDLPDKWRKDKKRIKERQKEYFTKYHLLPMRWWFPIIRFQTDKHFYACKKQNTNLLPSHTHKPTINDSK